MSDPELICLGRVNLDLYAQQVGVEFADVTGWDAMVGGSPANVAVAAARLGVRTGMLSAVGDDLVGDWVLRALARAGVDTALVARKPGPHTSLALRAQRAPDHPLAFYRHDPADIHLVAADAARAPVELARAVLVSADALARGSTADACAGVLRRARGSGVTSFLDLDLRDVSWPDHEAYATAIAPALGAADVVLGTESEFAAALQLPGRAAPRDIRQAVAGAPVVIVKQGERGAALFVDGHELHVPAFRVREASTVGAGDSFAAGLVAARLRGDDWLEAARYASACAAITVSRFGCSGGFPDAREVAELLDRNAVAAQGSA